LSGLSLSCGSGRRLHGRLSSAEGAETAPSAEGGTACSAQRSGCSKRPQTPSSGSEGAAACLPEGAAPGGSPESTGGGSETGGRGATCAAEESARFRLGAAEQTPSRPGSVGRSEGAAGAGTESSETCLTGGWGSERRRGRLLGSEQTSAGGRLSRGSPESSSGGGLAKC